MGDVFAEDTGTEVPDALEGFDIAARVVVQGEKAEGIGQVILHVEGEDDALLTGMDEFRIHHGSGDQSVTRKKGFDFSDHEHYERGSCEGMSQSLIEIESPVEGSPDDGVVDEKSLVTILVFLTDLSGSSGCQ